jgi:hypothetical protein
VISALLVFSAAPTIALPQGATTATDTLSFQHPLVDSNENRISDGLEAIVAAAGPNDLIDVMATFQNDGVAGRSERILPQQSVNRRFSLISGFSASLNAGQITALSNQPGVIRVEENFTVSIANDNANAIYGTALARADYGVDGGIDGLGQRVEAVRSCCCAEAHRDDVNSRLFDTPRDALLDGVSNRASLTAQNLRCVDVGPRGNSASQWRQARTSVNKSLNSISLLFIQGLPDNIACSKFTHRNRCYDSWRTYEPPFPVRAGK